MKQMHPRNIYNKRCDFNSLINVCPEFKKHVKIGVDGKIAMNFKDPEALRALAKALLKKDFNLDIEIPINTLIPTIPLRLNYILFIEDLLMCANLNSGITGIDIGTGASCIYPLLAVRKNKWKMVATECNAVNLKYATNNVIKNNLEGDVIVIEVSGQTTLKELLDKDNMRYTFSMCNPPFFQGAHELSSQLKSRKAERKKPNNAFCASTHEVITQGGEVEFVTKIITESHDYKNRVKIFTTMLGIRKSLQPITDILKHSTYVNSYTQTEFFQGHTTRWGVAWTFQDDIDLKGVAERTKSKHTKKKKPFLFSESHTGTIDNIGIQLEEIFETLKMQYKVLEKEEHSRVYDIVAYFDTWSHNRLKRREAKRMGKLMEGISPVTLESCTEKETKADYAMNTPMETSFEDIPKVTELNIVGKRRLSNSDEESEVEESRDNKKMHVEHTGQLNARKLIEASVYAHLEDDVITIEMDSLSDNANRDNLHQILQYIKNHLKLI